MKKRKVLGVSFLSILLCFPLLGFKYSNEKSTTANSSSTSILQEPTSSTSIISESSEQSTDNSMAETFSSDLNDESVIEDEERDAKTEKPIVQADPSSENFYISVIDENYELLEEPDGEPLQDSGENYQKTFSAQEVISDSGAKYYLLSSSKGQMGYIKPESTARVTRGEGKLFSETNTYGSINSTDATLFSSDFQENGTTSTFKDHTFKKLSS